MNFWKLWSALTISCLAVAPAADWERHYLGVSGIHTMRFAGPDTGFAIGDSGKMIRTVNGGKNWTRLSMDTALSPLRFMQVSNGRTAWIVGGKQRHSVGNSPAFLYRTTDGGDTWHRIKSDTSFYFFSLQFQSADTGWASGFVPTDSTVAAFRTVDGGVTWQQTTASVPWKGSTFTRLWMTPNKRGLLIGCLETTNGGPPVYYCAVQRTVDGLTWTESSRTDGDITLAKAKSCHHATDTSWCTANSYWGDRIDRIVGEQVQTGFTWSAALASVDFRRELGYAAGTLGTLVRTADRGTTWQWQESGTKRDLSNLQIVSPTAIYMLAGSDSLIRMDASIHVPLGVTPRSLKTFFALENGTFTYRLPYAARVSIAVLDPKGRNVLRLRDVVQAPGSHSLRVPLEGLAPGRYVIDFKAGGLRDVVPLVKNP